MSALGKLPRHTEFHDAIGTAVPLFIELLHNKNPDVREAAISTLVLLSPTLLRYRPQTQF